MITQFILSLITPLAFLFWGNGASTAEKSPSDYRDSQIIRESDPKIDSLVGIPIKESWWSRGHEYAWASQFAGEDLTVLDAACGVTQPFKWYLGETCKETWACDIHFHLGSRSIIVQRTLNELGETAHHIISSTPRLIDQVRLFRASITQLPDDLPLFDRIFCLSALFHLSPTDQGKALSEFVRVLAPDGLVVITINHPTISLEDLIATAESVGLTPAGEVDITTPYDALTHGDFSIYRLVLKHR